MVANSVFDMEFDQIPVDLESETLFDQFIYDDVSKLGTPFGDISLQAVGDILANASNVAGNSFYTGNEFGEEREASDHQSYVESDAHLIGICETEAESNKGAKNVKKQGGANVGSEKKVPRHRPTSRNAARERSRVKSLRTAFMDLQNKLPAVPPNTKLSKLDVLVLATTYIAYLMKNLDNREDSTASDVNAGCGLDGAVAVSFAEMTSLTEEFHMADSTAGATEVRHHRLHEKGYLHPVKKWPIRSRLYAGVSDENHVSGSGDSSSIGQMLNAVSMTLPVLDASFDMLSLP